MRLKRPPESKDFQKYKLSCEFNNEILAKSSPLGGSRKQQRKVINTVCFRTYLLSLFALLFDNKEKQQVLHVTFFKVNYFNIIRNVVQWLKWAERKDLITQRFGSNKGNIFQEKLKQQKNNRAKRHRRCKNHISISYIICHLSYIIYHKSLNSI